MLFSRHLYDALFLSEPHRSGVSTCWTRAFHARQLQGTGAPSSAAPSANSIRSAARPRVAVCIALWLDVVSERLNLPRESTHAGTRGLASIFGFWVQLVMIFKHAKDTTRVLQPMEGDVPQPRTWPRDGVVALKKATDTFCAAINQEYSKVEAAFGELETEEAKLLSLHQVQRDKVAEERRVLGHLRRFECPHRGGGTVGWL